jgi:hypothetical protein
MAIEKTVIIKVKSEQAAKDLKDINSIIDEQRDILVLLEEEYIKAKKALDNYNKSGKVNLAQEKQLKQALSERKDALTDQRLGLKKLAVEQRASNKAIKEGQKLQKENTNIVRAIDKLTGGYATKVIKLKKGFVSGFGAVKNFVKGLSGIKKALIATGIGALIVGLATVVAYWEEITALFDNGSKALQKQSDEQRKNVQLSDEQLALLDQQEKLLTLQGKSTETIVAEKKKVLLIQQEQNESLLQTLKLQLQKEQSQVRELSFFEKSKAASLEALGQYEAAAKIRAKGMMASEEELDKIKELEEEIQQSRLKGGQIDIALATIDANKKKSREKDAKDREKKDAKELKEIERQNKEKLRLEKEYQNRLKNLKDRIREAEAVTEEEQRELKLKKLKEEHAALMAEALANGLLSEELISSLKQREKDLLAQFDEEDTVKAEKRRKDEAKKEKIAADYKEKEYRETYNNLQDVVALGGKKMEKVGKALAIADVVRSSVKSVSETISNTGAANAKAVLASPLTGGMPFVGINTAKAALSIGSTVAGANKSIQAIKGDAKSVGGAAVPSSGGGGGSAPTPPQFNIVGATETSQLAEAVAGQENQPIQAYVVSNDVTTAQSLENNIVEGATIGS